MPATREQCDTLLLSLFPDQPHLIEKWWSSPNKAFDMLTPLQMLEEDSLRVVKYLWNQLDSPYM